MFSGKFMQIWLNRSQGALYLEFLLILVTQSESGSLLGYRAMHQRLLKNGDEGGEGEGEDTI